MTTPQVGRQDVGRLVQAIKALHAAVGDHLKVCGKFPAADSQAARELAELSGRASMFEPYNQGNFLIEVAADHLSAFNRTLVEPVQTIAPWTSVRSLLESCALAAWLLDPNMRRNASRTALPSGTRVSFNR